MRTIKEMLGGYKLDASFRQQLKNPVFFIRHVIGLDLRPFHVEWIKMAENNRFVAIQAPRGHGKTETLLISYLIFKAYTQKKFSGLLISHNMEQNRETLRRIRSHIHNNELLRESIPTDREADWSRTVIELSNESRIMCRAFGDSVRGSHVDVCGCDEVGMYKDHQLFYDAVNPTVEAKEGKLICIGTPQSREDLINKLCRNDTFTSGIYPAINEKGEALWPRRFNLTKLHNIKRRIGTISFSREYLCNPLAEETQVFPYTLISEGFDYNLKLRSFPKPNCDYFIGCDFAMSGAVRADYTVFVVLERDLANNLIIVEMWRVKGSKYETQKAYLEQLNDKYKPLKILIDQSTFGEPFLQELKQKGLPIYGFKFQGKKYDLVTLLINSFENKMLIVPKDDKDLTTKTQIEDLVKELLNFGIVELKSGGYTFRSLGGHDDIVIALALANYAAKKLFGISIPSVKRSHGARKSINSSDRVWTVSG